MVDASSNGKIIRAYETLFGPPYPGLEARVNAFITTFEAVEKTRHAENQEQLERLNQKMSQRSLWVTIAGVAISFASLMVGIAAIAATVYLSHHSEVEPTKLFSHQPAPVVSYSKTPEDSGMDPTQEATQQ